MKTVTVELGDRSYDILVGSNLIADAGKRIKQALPKANCVIITDENVDRLHGDTLRGSLDNSGITNDTIRVAAGEKSKSLGTLETVLDQLLEFKLERGDCVLALGGGVVGDLAGFAAAILKRGTAFIQIPTSLLAQVDSSVGGKTGINARQGKNLIGAFYQPQLVLADTDVLKTLSPREFAAGYAEVAKYGLINKPDFFSWLEENHQDLFSFGPSLETAIATSCQAKADVVAEDERENGARALLNLGHTFGHALEGFCEYDPARLVHGEGVAIGMCLAHEFSNRMNLCSSDDAHRVTHHLEKVGLPTKISDIEGPTPTPEELMTFIVQDKKVSRGELTFILTRGIGQSFVSKDVPASEVELFLKEAIE